MAEPRREPPAHQADQRERWTARAAVWRAHPSSDNATTRISSELMLAALDIQPNLRVLDVACGPGEPALTIAAGIAEREGSVLATDLVEEMLALARENADARGVRNIDFQQADAEYLPFADESFDAATCRHALMLLPDAPRALREMRRVLVPGGRIVILLAGPPELSARERPLAIVRKYVALPEMPPGAPDRFRYSGPGELTEQLSIAGFRDITETRHTLSVDWIGTVEDRWSRALRNSRRLTRAVASIPPEQQQALTAEVLAAFRAEEARGAAATTTVVVGTGVR